MIVEFTCEVCGASKRKHWSARMPGRPRFCCWDCKSEFQRRAKPVSREWLEQKYTHEGLDCVQIGKLVNRDPKSVWNWMKDFGIVTRPRGHRTDQLRRGCAPGFKHSPETRARLREIAKADGRVPYHPEVGSYMKGRKGADTPNWKGGVTPERQEFYRSAEWKAAVRMVYARDKRTCQRCGKVKTANDPFDIHHIISFACTELRVELSNLVLLCETCHYWVHGKENKKGDFIKPWPP